VSRLWFRAAQIFFNWSGRTMTRNKRQSRLQAEIDANLKRAYEEVLKEDVPDRFTELLDRLKSSDSGQGEGTKADDN
jgi:hypothetical protein